MRKNIHKATEKRTFDWSKMKRPIGLVCERDTSPASCYYLPLHDQFKSDWCRLLAAAVSLC